MLQLQKCMLPLRNTCIGQVGVVICSFLSELWLVLANLVLFTLFHAGIVTTSSVLFTIEVINIAFIRVSRPVLSGLIVNFLSGLSSDRYINAYYKGMEKSLRYLLVDEIT